MDRHLSREVRARMGWSVVCVYVYVYVYAYAYVYRCAYACAWVRRICLQRGNVEI